MSSGRTDSRPFARPGILPRITACICTHNRPDYLRDCLDGLRAQTLGAEAFDILVVDSGSAAPQAARIAALVDETANARLIRVDQPGLSRARNAAAQALGNGYAAFLDDDAIPAVDWIAAVQAILGEEAPAPALLAGAVWPLWEAPLPAWWPTGLRGLLSIIEAQGRGDFRRPGMARQLEPYGANMIVDVRSLLAQGGFAEAIGRHGESLLSDEEKVLAWRLQDDGQRVCYDSRVVVHHQIQAERLTVQWLLRRMYWQGVSRVRSTRCLDRDDELWREAVRRLAILLLLAPMGLFPRRSAWLIALRWRWAYARGFWRALLETGPIRLRGRMAEHGKPRPSIGSIDEATDGYPSAS
jgi:glucosyl-dolichyl phosphate glucuronosyltransferase